MHITRALVTARALVTCLALGSVSLVGCATSEAPLDGTFAGTSTIPLPSPPLPMLDLTIDSVLDLDAATSRFTLDMDLAADVLTDEMHVTGTYVTANGMLTLRPETITASPGSAPSTAEDGAHCIALAGFAQTVVCLPESTSAYTLSGNQLSFTLEDRIADVDGSVAMTLTRAM